MIRRPLVGDQLLALGSEYSVKLVGLGQVSVWLLFDHHLHVGGDVDYGESLVKMSAPHKYLDILTWGKKNIKISSKGRLMLDNKNTYNICLKTKVTKLQDVEALHARR